MEAKVTIREAKPADMAAVGKLGSRYGMGEQSPPPSAENTSRPIEQKGWVMVTEQGEVVGFLNSILSRKGPAINCFLDGRRAGGRMLNSRIASATRFFKYRV